MASNGDGTAENRAAVIAGDGTNGERKGAWAAPRRCLRVSV